MDLSHFLIDLILSSILFSQEDRRVWERALSLCRKRKDWQEQQTFVKGQRILESKETPGHLLRLWAFSIWEEKTSSL
jgi:hypothetical protein